MSPVRIALISLILLPPLSAHAQLERCVRTVAEFNSAWVLADDDEVLIKMAAGTYDFDGATTGGIDDDVVIRGGYNSSCSSRSDDPAATVITRGSGQGIFFKTHGNGFEGAGTLRIEGLTFRGLGQVSVQAEGFNTNDSAVHLDRVWFDQVQRFNLDTGAEFSVRNSLFTRSGSCALRVGFREFDGTPVETYLERITIRHSTFANNAGPGLCVGRTDFAEDDWRLELGDSVFWDNGGVDIQLNNPAVPTIDAVLRNNTYTTLQSNRALRTAPVATSTANPQFVDAAAGNWRLSGGSPAINSGRVNANLLNQGDFEGNPRWFGEAPDRGAFESSIGSTATVLTVTNTNDAGLGSLRQALIDANAAPNLNEIRFNIGGACPRTITLAGLLPDIVQPVRIDGYSQPGASRNTAVLGWNANLCIVLNGANQLTGAYGFNVNTGASPDATVSIEGIAFSGHSFAAAQFIAGRDHRFVGNQIGGVVGSTLLASGTGVRIGGTVEGVRVGGPEPAERNVIAATLGAGISISGSESVQPRGALVQNNYIGTQSGGDVRGNERGILITAPGHVVRDNVIANAASHGIELSGALATGNRISGNRIGLPALCLGDCADRGNGGHGVFLRNGANDNLIDSNQIAFNALDGVAITGARRNTLRRNASHAHGGIGIDLGDDGRNLVEANNAVAAPIAAGNDSQNAPVLSRVAGSAEVGLASGSLSSSNGWYRIDFYASDVACSLVFSGGQPAGFHGEGRFPLGSTFLQISNGSPTANGSASFTDVELRLAGASGFFVPGGTWVLATATRMSGPPLVLNQRYLGTSEFGRCRSYVEGPVSEVIFANGFEGSAP